MTTLVKQTEILGNAVNVYGTVEEPLFLAKDVAKWIDHSNVTVMLSSIDNEEVTKLNLGGRAGETNALTEDGVYEVLMQSRKPIARAFKKGVKTMLKTIRQTGGYVAENAEEKFIETYFPNIAKDEAAKNIMVEQLKQTKQLVAENQAQAKRIEVMQPKEEYYDIVTQSTDEMDMEEVAKNINFRDESGRSIGRNKLFEILRKPGGPLMSGRNKNRPYQWTIDRGFFRIVETEWLDGMTPRINRKTVVTQKGKEAIIKFLRKKGCTCATITVGTR